MQELNGVSLTQTQEMKRPVGARPLWLKTNLLPSGEDYKKIKRELKSRSLATVCEEAKCPNIGECWEAKTATVMILGDTCTRACRFCHVKTGNPKGFIDPFEVEHTSEMVGLMSLRYVVITSVDRDDLPDYGASHFAAVVERVRADHPGTKVEVLIPDFHAEKGPMHILAKSDPFVVAQNLETVERLTHPVRDKRAGYSLTLDALSFYKTHYPHIVTKSSLMVGLGETREELRHSFRDLRDNGVEILTLGQYLRPSRRHYPVEKYYHPSEFEELKEEALGFGFSFVASGPLVRSSYKASEFLDYIEKKSTPLS